ncbi:MAG: ATP-dependent RNA helicase HrpA [Syntrophobacteraceae bacterium]|nr:ATP-dependent RNA helicase HrpA [Syntrophobacteraceae bacterium]
MMALIPPDTESDISQSLSYPCDLPIMEWREKIVTAVREHQVLVITGETGSGKSTQIPKFCMEAGRGQTGMIGCTQPRRIAAVTLAARVSEELGTQGLALVGYKIRFQDRTARTTRIKFMTDGVLLAEAQRDKNFRAYDTIIVDEAHERSLNIDFLIGIIKQSLAKRGDLKVIVTSATIDPEKFSRAFGGAPIIEVSGRMYPVEVMYMAEDRVEPEEPGDATYIDRAVEGVELLKKSGPRERGDILIFMPTESDILETVQRIEGKSYAETVVMPLFGRMAASDQQRVFASISRQKIIVATNIAETSITIPGIRYVIDAGLARTAQYNPRSKTRALPVARISRASADQRKGRCGRVQAGVCIRLYSEEDYLDRPLFTPPEIQRSNLSEVILRMLYLKLGRIEDFPFIDPPSAAAIKDGFAILRELGAVDDQNGMSQTGRVMARMPLDPRISRMLIEAKKESAIEELEIIGAALSIQDPRERPLDHEEQARQAQAVFRDPRSDFVSLLKIWQACWGAPGAGGAKQLKKFCRDHFLSFRRMREWRDIYEELRSILGEIGGFAANASPAGYEGVHRSILSGYLSQVGLRKEKNLYTAARGRQAMLFPGSTIFNKGGAWIVACELVQTTRLFARTAATIDPEWIETVGRHVLKYSWSEPHWEKNRGQVVAFEKATAYGLTVVERRKVAFEPINPVEARDIFIRSALVERELPAKYGFLAHNFALLCEIEQLENKARRKDLLADEQALYEFYETRIPQICDIRSFDKLIKDRGGDQFLRMKREDLLRSQPDFDAAEQFPDTLAATGAELPLRYTFSPGEKEDGITLTVPVHTLPALRGDAFEWLVPGMVQEKVAVLLKSLPKELRRRLAPLGDTARRILPGMAFGEGDFYARLGEAVFTLTGIRVDQRQWEGAQLPEHLRMRFEVVGESGNVLASGRNIEALRSSAVDRHEDHLWREARKALERDEVTGPDFGELPRRVTIGADAMGIGRFAWPGLADEDGKVAVRLFTEPGSAAKSSQAGLMRLYKLAFAAELKTLGKSWAFPDTFASRVFFMGGINPATSALYDYILRMVFGLEAEQHPERAIFLENLQRLKGRLGVFGNEIREPVLSAVEQRQDTVGVIDRFTRMAGANRAVSERLFAVRKEVEATIPPDFLSVFPERHVRLLVRYLKGLSLRAERAYVYPEKDRAKESGVLVYVGRLGEIGNRVLSRPTQEGLDFVEETARMIEEFKISLFAPEMKTLFPISSKRIETKLSGFSG